MKDRKIWEENRYKGEYLWETPKPTNMSSIASFNYYDAFARMDAAALARMEATLARMDAAAVADRAQGTKRKDAPPTDDDRPPEKSFMYMNDDEIRERVAHFMADICDRNYDQRIVVSRVIDTRHMVTEWKVEQIVAAAFAAKFAAWIPPKLTSQEYIWGTS